MREAANKAGSQKAEVVPGRSGDSLDDFANEYVQSLGLTDDIEFIVAKAAFKRGYKGEAE